LAQVVKAPAESCPETKIIGSLDRKEALSNLKLINESMDKNELLSPVLMSLEKIQPKDPAFFSSVQHLSFLMNQIQFPKEKRTAEMNQILGLWEKFPTTASRSELGLGKNDGCLFEEDKKFSAYSQALKEVMKTVFAKTDVGKDMIPLIDQIELRPSGTQAFYAAAHRVEETPKGWKSVICINPDEAPPNLLVRMMHEYKHAQNKSLNGLHREYRKKFEDWATARKKFDAKQNTLQKRFGELFNGLDGDVQDITDELEELDSDDQDAIVEQLAGYVAEMASDEFLLNPEAFPEMTTNLSEWSKERKVLEKSKIELLALKGKIDVERYLDEHRAYAIDYHGGRQLVASMPKFFCELWVPSYRYQRPVRYFQIFQEVEHEVAQGRFSEWLANKYTFEGKSYLPQSLYTNGSKNDGLLPAVHAKALELMHNDFRVPVNHSKSKKKPDNDE
jgi:hypothetical protein